MKPDHLIILSVLLLAAAALLIGGALLRRAWQATHSEKTLDRGIQVYEQTATIAEPADDSHKNWLERMVIYAADWVDTPLGKQLVAEEDRFLLDQCGVNDMRGKTLFFVTRAVLGIGLPLCGWILVGNGKPLLLLSTCFCCFALGYMGPKWVMQFKARERRLQAAAEIPLFIDLLRLLQGVGLSIDQSLNVIENDFSGTLPVLSKELQIAARQYLNGRTREQSLRRFSTIFENDDLNAIARLIVQISQYGGAVQQALQQFGERVREQRKLEMKEKVGKLTVKMTGVMVLTLLPALLIITGGAGFLAIIRTLSKIGS